MTELELRHRFDLMDEVKEFAIRGVNAAQELDELHVRLTDMRQENYDLRDEVDTLSNILSEICELVENEDRIETVRKEIQRLCDENRI